MSENHPQQHSSFIKTPKQLLIVVIFAHIIPIALILMLVALVTGGADHKANNPGLSDEAIARRVQPVGQVNVVDANAPKVVRSGKEVVETVCAACHATGALNAPKIGDKAAWAKLIKEGHATLTADAIKGIRQMPPRGGSPDLSDVEVARAVAYMANQAGANFKEPEAPAAAPAAAKPSAAAPATVAAAPAAAPAGKGGDASKGKAAYDATCNTCHGTGVAGAPKTGDKAAWAPRLKAGMEQLYTSALKGKNAMPPKGGNLSLPDAEVKAAVDFMVGQSK